MSQTTFEAVRRIADLQIEALAPIQLKGKRDPVQLYRVCPKPAGELVVEQDGSRVEAD